MAGAPVRSLLSADPLFFRGGNGREKLGLIPRAEVQLITFMALTK